MERRRKFQKIYYLGHLHMPNKLAERDKEIILASKKIKALQHLHKFSGKIRDKNETEEFQKNLEFEMKLTLMQLDAIIGLNNLETYAKAKGAKLD